MPRRIHCPHCKDDIILRKFHGRMRHIADILRMLPFRPARRAPQHFVARRQPTRCGVPRQRRIVLQLLGYQMHIRRRGRSRSQRCQRRRIQPCDMRGVVVIDKLRQVPIFDAVFRPNVLMLMMKVLALLRKAHRRKPLLIKRKMIAAAQVTVQTEDQQRLDSRVIGLPHFRDIPRQLPRSRVILAAQPANPP